MEDVNYTYTPARIFNEKWWLSHIDPEMIRSMFENGLKISGFHILNFSEHFFDIQGYTCVWLLAESHLAIHTFPEDNKIYIELSSCNESKLKHFKTWINSTFDEE